MVTAVVLIWATISAALAVVTAEVPAPLSKAPEVNVVAPVPPLATGSVPVTLVVKLTNVVDVVPVPPLAIGSVPVTPVVRGRPVAFVSVAEVGVPKIGVTNVGLVDNTLLPEPVEVVTPVPPFSTGSVPVTLVAKLTNVVDVVPVPPFATGSVPVTPVVKGRPVRLVATPDDGVPKAGVTKVGEVAKTLAPLPVSSVKAVAS